MPGCGMLRMELSERARRYAIEHALPHSLSYGSDPIVCFEPFGDCLHGNFHPASYKAIRSRRDWSARLSKVHTTARRCLPSAEIGKRSELDSCMSSDALLMNVFCHPRVSRSAVVLRRLGIETGCELRFRVRARVPLLGERVDATEVDMKAGDLLLEAKLTETDFQTAAKSKVLRYRDFREVFNEGALPQTSTHYCGYQLIRNVLGARDQGGSFCVLLDGRRSDLLESWFAVMSCVKPVALRTACKLLTWQELASLLPRTLQEFLSEKYGIC
jgi:hypothetical protein